MKEYVKPDLFYESFELSQHIAACGIDMNSADTNNCNANLDSDFWGISDTVFNSGDSECSIDIDVIEAYCYTSGTNETGRAFNS